MGVVACTIGINPHVKVFLGFCKRMWGDQNVDKVIVLKKGVFLIRFLNHEAKNKALKASHLMFDKRPVFLKQWEDGMEFENEELQKVPVWVQLPELPLKYWGFREAT